MFARYVHEIRDHSFALVLLERATGTLTCVYEAHVQRGPSPHPIFDAFPRVSMRFDRTGEYELRLYMSEVLIGSTPLWIDAPTDADPSTPECAAGPSPIPGTAIPSTSVGGPRIFYRLVTADPPTLDDFRSYDALGKQPLRSKRDDPDFLRRWKGLSVYDTYKAARDLAESRHWKRWAHIAILHIPHAASVTFEGPEAFGHWNVYGADPTFLRDACVVRVLHAPDIQELPST